MFHITTCLYRHGVADLAGVWKGRAAVCWISSVPDWWQRGWPRDRVGSMAEAELLSQLAVVLKPRTPIKELFRSFPAPKGWGGNYLEPDLAAYGVLKNAALFVEYDGYWRHGEAAGIAKDHKKNAALLVYAPAGSRIVRIRHARSRPKESDDKNVIWIDVTTWRLGDQESVWKVLRYILQRLLAEPNISLLPKAEKRLQQQVSKASMKVVPRVKEFCSKAALLAGRNTPEEMSVFLGSEGFNPASIKLVEQKLCRKRISIERQLQPLIVWLLSLGLTTVEAAKVLAYYPPILDCSVAENLKPTFQWFLETGLSEHELARAIVARPPILTYSIEHNLKPTVQFFLSLGLARNEVAKTIAKFPQIVGLSIQQNLRPKISWFSSLGLQKAQIARMILVYPRIIGFSMDQNLKPTAQWFLDFGLSKDQLAKCVSGFPQILGQNVERSFRQKVELLQAHFPTRAVIEMIARCPRILSYSQGRLKKRLEVLARLAQKEKLVSALVLRDDLFQRRYGQKRQQHWCPAHFCDNI